MPHAHAPWQTKPAAAGAPGGDDAVDEEAWAALVDDETAAEAEAVAVVLRTYYHLAHPPFATASKVNRLIRAHRCQVEEVAPPLRGDGMNSDPPAARWVDELWAAFGRVGADPLAACRSTAPLARAAVTLQQAWRRHRTSRAVAAAKGTAGQGAGSQD